MKNLIIAVALLCASISSRAQITLAHSFGPAYSNGEIVNLSLSGKKIMVVSALHIDSTVSPWTYTDTVNFYNLDYSFWKRVICPNVPGYSMYLTASFYNYVMVYYPSETLFNTDPLLEIAVPYVSNAVSLGKIMIINETGAIVDSMTNVAQTTSMFNQYNHFFKIYAVDTLGIGFQALVSTPTGVDVYNLPGTIPCSLCSGNGLGVAKNEKKDGFETQPLPNPSSNEVKITFKLPDGASQGNLVLYNTNGQKIKSFQVDNRFGFVMLDNSQLVSGVYYYNIEVNGQVSSTQKLVVIK